MINPINLNGIIMLYGKPFVEITNKEVPNVRPGYYLNIDGTVYNSVVNRFRYPTLDSDGRYFNTELRRTDGSRVSIKTHKLIMRVFNYTEGCENLEVNHKNGVKTNNDLCNLEWTTHSENVQHAYDTGLMQSGENNKFAVLTEKQVREICTILKNEERYVGQYDDIASKYNVSKSTILNIANGYNWVQISKEYDLDYSFRLHDRFTKEEVHKICKIFQDNLNTIGYKGCYEMILNELNLERKDSVRRRIRLIYNRNPGYFKKITDQYYWEII